MTPGSGMAPIPVPEGMRLLDLTCDTLAEDLALDEALLLGRLAGTTPPTLRFFAWRPPTISLGYGQPLDARPLLGSGHEFQMSCVAAANDALHSRILAELERGFAALRDGSGLARLP